MKVTHLGICRSVARYMLLQRWCAIAGWEIGGPDVLVTRGTPDGPPPPGWSEQVWLRAHERRRGTVLDVVALNEPGASKGRIALVEVKRTVGDLQADLRRGKMQRYAELRGVTHLYLAGPPEVVDRGPELGLPESWGIIHTPVRENRTLGLPGVARRATSTGLASPEDRVWWALRFARAYGWRLENLERHLETVQSNREQDPHTGPEEER